MKLASRQYLRRLNYFQWLSGSLVLGILGVLAAWLPNTVSLAILSLAVVIGALLMKPHWMLFVLLLLRSSADSAQSLFVFFPGTWYSVNATGIFNLLALGIGLFLIGRRFARGQDCLPSTPIKIYALFLAFAAVGITQSMDASLSLKEWSRLAGSLGIALLVLESVRGDKDVLIILRLITIAALAPLVVGYYQAATGGGYYFEGWEGTVFAFRPQGTLGHPAILATFLILVSSLALAGFITAYPLWPRLCLVGLAGACWGLILLTFARTEWIGAITALGALALMRYRRLFLVGIAVAVVVMLAVPSVQNRLSGANASESFDWRLEVWDASLNLLHQPTLMGTGLDTSPILINKLLYRITSPPHNDYLKIAIELGVVGILIYGLLLISLIRLGWQTYHACQPGRNLLGLTILVITASGLVISLADNYISYTSVQWYYWTIIALAVKTGPGILNKEGMLANVQDGNSASSSS